RAHSERPLRARTHVALDVLRAVQPRTERRHRALLDQHARQDAGGARREADREEEGRLRRARRIGGRLTRSQVPRGSALLSRRYRTLRVHAPRSRGRLRSRALPEHSRLVRSRRESTALGTYHRALRRGALSRAVSSVKSEEGRPCHARERASDLTLHTLHSARKRAQGINTVDPRVRRDSSARCASAASRSAKVCPMCAAITPRAIKSKSS